MRFLFLLALGFFFVQILAGGGTESAPRSLLVKPASVPKRLLVGSALVGAGVLGKRLYDGPVFNEPVDLSGKVIAITGANTGLGKESALKLASLGAELILLCRNEAKAQSAVADIIAKTGNKNVRFVKLDLEDLSSVSRAADELKKTLGRLDVLQLNSGVMALPVREVTKDGFEKHIGINHLGHFALTKELWPLLKRSASARVVTVSSSAHLLGKIDRNNLMLEGDSYAPWLQYGNSKLANILFCRELSRRLAASGNPKQIVSVCLHPGACRTELGRYIFDPASIPPLLMPLVGVVAAPAIYLTKSAYMGSQTQSFLSASSKISPSMNGVFFDNSRPADTSAEAKDSEQAQWLWKESERLVGGSFDV